MRRWTVCCAALALVGLGTLRANASINLLNNGDFEQVDGRIGLKNGFALNALGLGQWDVYNSLPGAWTTTQGPGIEVGFSGGYGGIEPHSGTHLIELDSNIEPNPNSSMTQTVNLDAFVYELSYYYHARTDVPDDNRIDVFLDLASSSPTNLVSTSNTHDPSVGWLKQSVLISITQPGAYDLTFAAAGIGNSYGGLLDDVSLTPIPEPATFIIWSLLGALTVTVGWYRGRKAA